MWQSDEINELAKSLGALQSEMTPLKTNKVNPFFKSRYADLEAVTQHIKPLLVKHGLSYTQFPSSKQSEPMLVTQVMHSSGQYIRAESKLFLVKQDQQSVGSATTYAKRQALQAAFGVAVTDEDDDGESASAMPMDQVRKLYQLAKEAQGVVDEHGFMSLITEYYARPVGRNEIPKEDYKVLEKHIKG